MTPPQTPDELAAVLAGLETVAPDRRARAIATRMLALMVRTQARGFEYLTQADAAKMLGVSESAISRAGDRVEEALAVYRRGDRKGEDILAHP